MCGSEDDLEMHHLRKMSDIDKKGKKPWQINMISRQRKTLAVCSKCHLEIHYGS
ncbi:hypothetical protein [Dyadobacter sp. CY312]|uniref:HNH endonuclease n=1 Tax=Dyadobacter sp. CY312 TaxID=2907303 RepID=UPI0038D3B70C